MRFSENVAVNNIFCCESIMAADEEFRKACELCCNSPRCQWHDCDHCRVAEMHESVILMLKAGISTTQ